MFFSTYVLTKKGPLAKVWLAAHWDRRLTRHEVKAVDLSQTIMHIVRPVVPIALRTSGELLVGVVRIYVLKVRHLLRDATEATLFLRVSTMQAKGATAGATAASGGKGSKSTTIDGVLVRGKGDVEAVTFDWGAEGAAKHGGLPAAAEALHESRFDAIADLLGADHVAGLHKEDGLLAQAWFTVEPSSQAAEGAHSTQGDFDEIARMRADLMAFGDRASGSSASRSRSSLPSVEQGRGSAAIAGAIGDDVPFPDVAGGLDLGVPLPDDLASDVPLLGTQEAAGLPEDMFAVPDVLDAAAPPPARSGRKATPPVNIVDLAATTLSGEALEKSIADRGDILSAEPRRGPLDEAEERDRYVISGAAGHSDALSAGSSAPAAGGGDDRLAIADAVLLSAQPNPALRAVYAAVLQQQTAAAAEAAARASQLSPAGRPSEQPMGAPAGDAAEFEAAAAAAQGLEEESRQSRKRAREAADSQDPGSLSASAVETLRRLRTETARAMRRQSPEAATPEALVGGSCTLKGVCSGLRRREAARVFVDVLALTAKQFVAARQQPASGTVDIRLLEPSASVPAL